jgi:hypothetical protein
MTEPSTKEPCSDYGSAPSPNHAWATQLLTDVEAGLLAELGAEQFETLRARGADLAPADALAYLISAAQIKTA